jgi:hypothetical protein
MKFSSNLSARKKSSPIGIQALSLRTSVKIKEAGVSNLTLILLPNWDFEYRFLEATVLR